MNELRTRRLHDESSRVGTALVIRSWLVPIFLSEEGGFLARPANSTLAECRHGTRNDLSSSGANSGDSAAGRDVRSAFHDRRGTLSFSGALRGRISRSARREVRDILKPKGGSRYLYRIRGGAAGSCSDSSPADSLQAVRAGAGGGFRGPQKVPLARWNCGACAADSNSVRRTDNSGVCSVIPGLRSGRL